MNEDTATVVAGVEMDDGRWAILDDRGRFLCAGFDAATVLETLEECAEIAAAGTRCDDCDGYLLRCSCPDV